MITPEQQQKWAEYQKTNGIPIKGSSPSTYSAIDAAIALKQPTPPQDNMGVTTAKEVLAGADKMKSAVTEGADKFAAIPEIKTGSRMSPVDLIKNTAQRTGTLLETGLGAAAGAVRSIFSPFTAVFKKVADTTGVHPLEEFAKTDAGKKVQEWAQAHPEAAKNLMDAVTVGGAAVTDMGGAGDFLKTDVAKVAKNTPAILKEGAQGAVDAGKEIKNMVAPTPTIDKIVGQVAQGSTSDVPSFARGLSTLDTTKVAKYSDLEKAATDKITQLSKDQDTNLGADATPYKVQQLATPVKVGDSTINHNYVLDAVEQLKNFYEKTNDVKSLAEMKAYETRLNPTKGTGLTIKEVNDIARRHGTDLSGYNANGELASGLTKQAAENTRIGLKETVRRVNPGSKTTDAQMSDLFTVRDLAKNMAEKVTTLEQRVQKPNIAQKLGGIIGKGLRITGIGDLIGKLIGIDKVPGAQTLDALQLEAKLSKNLKRIDEALKKDDAGFAADIEKMVQEADQSPVSNSNVQPTADNPSIQPMNSNMSGSVPQ